MNVEPLPTPKQDHRQTSAPKKLEPLTPIPIPPEHQWRYFRVSILPFLAFAMVLGATVWLWGSNLANPLAAGEVEGVQADIITPRGGRVIQLKASLHQEVKAGDVLALIDFTEPAVRSNTVATIRAEMQAIKAEGGFNSGDRVRYSQFKLDWMTRNIEQAINTLAVPVGETNFDRDIQLFKDKFISISQLESNKLILDQLKMRVEQTPPTLAAAEKDLADLDPSGEGERNKYVQAALAFAEERLRLAESEMQPIPVTAPISGCVDKLDVLAGSTVAAGGVLMNIASPKADRIVTYISQPLRVDPKVGMKVQVRSRRLSREAGQALITSIGPRIESYTTPLRVSGLAAAQERGLPIIVSVPQKMQLLPGELVDLTFVLE